MSLVVSWIVEGEETILNDGTLSVLQGYDGFGMPPMHRLEERGPLQNGVTDRGYRLDPRMIMLALAIAGDDEDDFWDKRTQLVSLFKPRDTAGILRVTRGSNVRQIEGHLVDGLQFAASDQEYLHQKAGVAIKCPDPRWYDPVAEAISFALGGGGSSGEIPMTVSMLVGTSTLNVTQSITYEGSAESFPVITITGPITNPVITHVQTGYKLDLTGTTIGAGDSYVIDLRYSAKTIEDDSGTNKIADLTTDSDLVSFSILPEPDVEDGINTFTVTGSSVTAATKIEMSLFNMYLGI